MKSECMKFTACENKRAFNAMWAAAINIFKR